MWPSLLSSMERVVEADEADDTGQTQFEEEGTSRLLLDVFQVVLSVEFDHVVVDDEGDRIAHEIVIWMSWTNTLFEHDIIDDNVDVEFTSYLFLDILTMVPADEVLIGSNESLVDGIRGGRHDPPGYYKK